MNGERKICPKCGRYFGLNNMFCENCGVKLVRDSSSNSRSSESQGFKWDKGLGSVNYSDDIPDIVTEKRVPTAAEKEKGLNVLIALIVSLAAILIISLAVLIFLLLKDDDSVKDKIKYGGSESSESENVLEETSPAETAAAIQEEIVTSIVTVTEIVTEPAATEAPVKTFIVVSEACTWEQAKKKCEDMGGHLAYITCKEDYDAIVGELGSTSLKFVWLGGNSSINSNGTVSTSWLNGDSLDYINQSGLWYNKEPSGRDYSDPNAPVEPYLMLWLIDGKWSMNDNSNRAVEVYKSYRLGYVCQIDS
ncbi:MAG: lectin-like protein [Ruminococcus sp.]